MTPEPEPASDSRDLSFPGAQAWVEVDRRAISRNVAALNAWLGPSTDVMAVVKANGYGHGLVDAARAALSGGAVCLGVARIDEALSLRSAGVGAPILVLGCGLPEQAEDIVSAGVSQTVSGLEMAAAISAAAVKHGVVGKVHLKIDTGMGRVGTRPEAALDLCHRLLRLDGLDIEGVATHVPWEAPDDLPKIDAQLDRFVVTVDNLHRNGLRPRWRHAANSVATLRSPRAHLDLVRVGLLAYGILPSDTAPAFPLHPALAIRARITQVRALPAGSTISYGATHTVTKPAILALVPVGYADGYPRRLSNRGEVLVRGHRCPVVGAVCMDQIIIDVTALKDVRVGEDVTLLGRMAGDEIAVDQIVQWTGGIPHEVVSQISTRLPRVDPDPDGGRSQEGGRHRAHD